MSKFPMDFSKFELEITNRCNLGCPRCDRTDMIANMPRLWQTHDLNLEDFKRFIDPVMGEIDTFKFKGNSGDAIFHPEFINWAKWAKSEKKKISLHTNGQAGKKFWNQLSEVLDEKDRVILGIDGLPHNFMQYRINARWSNIIDCVDEIKGKAKLIWQLIRFKYNQDNVDEARELSKSLGFDEFLLIDSNRWWGDDPFQPDDSIARPTESNQKIDPLCLSQPMHTISADGYYQPCCLILGHKYRYKTPFGRAFNVREHTILDVIKSNTAREFFAKLNDDTALPACRYNCGKCDGK